MFVNTQKMLKLRFYIFPLFYLLVFGMVSCSESGEKMPLQVTPVDSVSNTPVIKDTAAPVPPTETFKGTYNDKEIVFSHKDFQSYTLSTASVATSGTMNTERGYGDDRDATVYVLNSDKPKSEQKYFVRTSQGSVYMLDQDRYVVDDAVFKPVGATAVKPPAAKKPEVAKSEEKKPVAKKQNIKKKTAGKDTLKSEPKVKKAPAKKTIKSAKKKKPVKKASKKHRKKSHKKKKARKSSKPSEPSSEKSNK
jgi:hypothetical protein